jgi:hypothetical protein
MARVVVVISARAGDEVQSREIACRGRRDQLPVRCLPCFSLGQFQFTRGVNLSDVCYCSMFNV